MEGTDQHPCDSEVRGGRRQGRRLWTERMRERTNVTFSLSPPHVGQCIHPFLAELDRGFAENQMLFPNFVVPDGGEKGL